MKYLRRLLVITLILTPFVGVYLLPKAVKIERIECKNQYGKCGDDLMDNLQVAYGRNLYEARSLVNNVIAMDSSISEFSIQYKLPNMLTIDLIDKDPKYAIKNGGGSAVAVIDGKGEVISFAESSNLPLLTVDSKVPNVGESVEKEILFACKLVYGVRLTNKISKSEVRNNSLFIKLNSGVKLIFPTSGDVDKLLGSSVLILSRLNTIDKDTKIDKTESVKEVDLRFDNPVVRY